MIDFSKLLGTYKKNYNLAHLTWLKIGGNAEVFFKPYNKDDLANLVTQNYHSFGNKLPIQVIGAGSNILVNDGAIKGIILKLGRNFTDISFDHNSNLYVGAGCLNFNLSKFCLTNGIKGFEFLIGIPGTIGGGVAMNAGAYNSEFKDILLSVDAIDSEGNVRCLAKDEIEFSYRKNNLPNDFIFTHATFVTRYGDKEKIKSLMDEIQASRQRTQPIYETTFGSVFKNPINSLENKNQYKSWQLIDQCGLRGKKIGGASISAMHCNFIINDGTATASDVDELCNYVQNIVYKQTGILLELEVCKIK